MLTLFSELVDLRRDLSSLQTFAWMFGYPVYLSENNVREQAVDGHSNAVLEYRFPTSIVVVIHCSPVGKGWPSWEKAVHTKFAALSAASFSFFLSWSSIHFETLGNWSTNKMSTQRQRRQTLRKWNNNRPDGQRRLYRITSNWTGQCESEAKYRLGHSGASLRVETVKLSGPTTSEEPKSVCLDISERSMSCCLRLESCGLPDRYIVHSRSTFSANAGFPGWKLCAILTIR